MGIHKTEYPRCYPVYNSSESSASTHICKYCSYHILSPYHSINHSLQKSEAFQSVHHVTFILCYTVLYNFLGLHCRFGRHRAEVHWTSCSLRFATVGAKRTSTGCPAPLYLPLSEFVNTGGRYNSY